MVPVAEEETFGKYLTPVAGQLDLDPSTGDALFSTAQKNMAARSYRKSYLGWC